jgi:hypothetical protein
MIAAVLLLLAAPAEEWQPLFDQLPRDSSGWAFENGVLHALPASPARTTDLYSSQRFSNFDLVVEYRVAPGGNSGIRYLPLPDQIAGVARPSIALALAAALAGVLLRRRRWFAAIAVLSLLAPIPAIRSYLTRHPLALEFQVLDNERHRDGGRGALYRAGALYGLSPAAQDSARRAGEWNQARVSVCGGRVQHWLNGVQVVDIDMASPSHVSARERFYTQGLYRVFSESQWRNLGWDRPSAVGLQHHGEEVWFRGAQIRRIPDACPEQD